MALGRLVATWFEPNVEMGHWTRGGLDMVCSVVPGFMGLELLIFCKIVIALITENGLFLEVAEGS